MSERCSWCGSDPLYVTYHDEEWGVPRSDPRLLWEMLTLEGFQSGLSWITILRKRETFRAAFRGFDPAEIATWGEAEITRLLQDPGIIRHRGKIQATIGNAQAYLKIEAREGFAPFLWKFVDFTPVQNNPTGMGDVVAFTPQSEAMSKALKKEGFRFCGPTTVYAFMQASGMVNDHFVTCLAHQRTKDMALGLQLDR